MLFMLSLPAIEVSGKERLKLLQRLDPARGWENLRDQRYCTFCGGIFSGREVVIVGGTRGSGPLRLQCPTTGCIGMAEAWLPARAGKLISATARSPRDLFVTHGGRAYTLQRIKRSKPEAAVITQGGAKTRARSALLRAMAATLHLLPVSLQQGRLFGELRGRAG